MQSSQLSWWSEIEERVAPWAAACNMWDELHTSDWACRLVTGLLQTTMWVRLTASTVAPWVRSWLWAAAANNTEWLVKLFEMNYIAAWCLLLVTQWHMRASSFTAMDPERFHNKYWKRQSALFSFLDRAFLRISFEFAKRASYCFSKQQRTLSGIQQSFGRPLILSNSSESKLSNSLNSILTNAHTENTRRQ